MGAQLKTITRRTIVPPRELLWGAVWGAVLGVALMTAAILIACFCRESRVEALAEDYCFFWGFLSFIFIIMLCAGGGGMLFNEMNEDLGRFIAAFVWSSITVCVVAFFVMVLTKSDPGSSPFG